MSENPYRSPDATKTEPTKVRFTWKDYFYAASFGIFAMFLCLFVSVPPFVVALEKIPAFREAVGQVTESLHVGPLVIFGALLASSLLVGTMAARWHFRAARRQQMIWLSILGVAVVGACMLSAVVRRLWM